MSRLVLVNRSVKTNHSAMAPLFDTTLPQFDVFLAKETDAAIPFRDDIDQKTHARTARDATHRPIAKNASLGLPLRLVQIQKKVRQKSSPRSSPVRTLALKRRVT